MKAAAVSFKLLDLPRVSIKCSKLKQTIRIRKKRRREAKLWVLNSNSYKRIIISRTRVPDLIHS